MKTLDEVIKAFEYTYKNDPIAWTYGVDALYYLKDYRMLVNNFTEKRQELEDEKVRYQKAIRSCEEAENKYKKLLKNLESIQQEYEVLKLYWVEQQENPPLTWSELKTLSGKPVWIEYLGYTSNWEIIENIGAIRGSIGDFTGNFIETNKSILHKEDQGKSWRAYRKEQK